jgi:ATP-dependent helicase/nuclease subunit B
MRAEARRLAAQGSAGPVIVAGVTGSIPASADLMRVVARLAAGAIVLPGLDQELDEESWRRIAPADRASAHAEHPQHSLARLLEALGTTRRAVTVLPGAHPTPAAAARARLVGEALRPAATTDRWYEFTRSRAADEIDAALAGLACIAAPSAQDEAEAVALILRRAAETPGRTAALVTPDRILARRVALRLESWGIRVDDSAGRPLAKTVPGAFLDLVIAAAERRFAPATLMALLKHPLLRLGLPVGQVRRAARALELIVFRRAHFGQGLAGVAAALDRPADDDPAGGRESRAGRRLRESDREAARALVAQLADAFAPLARLAGRDDARPLHEHAGAHLAAAEALARLAEADAPSPLWQGEAGEAAALVFTGLIDPTLPAPAVRAGEYPDLYRGLVATETVRARIPAHPRLSIWGPFEARLQQPDVLVLGGLNEGTWPAAAETGPWLNRPMRSTLGLPQPEAAIGNAAHDLSQLLGAGTVYLTRAAKVDGVPTVPSRWLLRLFAVLDGLGGPPAEVRLAPREPWLGWARSRDVARPEPRRETGPPAPRPALALRPRRLSVSDVETWIANPYAIFASRILGLEPLPALASPPDAALRGAILHTALRRFAAAHPDALPADVADRLVAEAAAALHALGDNPRVAAFWRPRLARFAAWFAESEPERRAGVTRVLAEVPGTRVLDAPAGPFVLTARADRIDLTPGGLVVTDYKTTAGLQPLARRALAGSAPQLALEAAIALAGGFPGVPAGPVTALRYISAAGGEPAGDSIDIESEDIAALARAAEEGLARLVARFDDPATPYAALRRARFDYTFDDYAHLARVAEWSGSREGDA